MDSLNMYAESWNRFSKRCQTNSLNHKQSGKNMPEHLENARKRNKMYE